MDSEFSEEEEEEEGEEKEKINDDFSSSVVKKLKENEKKMEDFDKKNLTKDSNYKKVQEPDDDETESDSSVEKIRISRSNRHHELNSHPKTLNLLQDSKTIENIRELVSKEFETEINTKKEELELIEKNVEQTKLLWERLQKLWLNRVFSQNILENRIVEPLSVENTEKKRGRSKSNSQPIIKKKKKLDSSLPLNALYYRQPSRGFVKMICPNCSKDVFRNQLGFVNHCRMVHQLKFATIDDAAELCGVPVEESIVPQDDPSRREITLGYYVEQVKLGILSSNMSSSSDFNFEFSSIHDKTQISTEDFSGSRFYIKKQVLVGNTSKPGSLKSSYKWAVYVRGTNEQQNISGFIKKVRFFLHPSFRPRNIVEVTTPPFRISRESNEAWPIRVQMHFVDPRNKPFSVIHYLTFHPNTTFETIAEENLIDIEIDRNYIDNMNFSIETNKQIKNFDQQEITDEVFSLDDKQNISSEVFFQTLIDISPSFPLISSESHFSLPYSIAKSVEEWYSWNHGKRKAAEWQRARQLKVALQDKIHIKKKTREIVDACLELNLTPPSCNEDFIHSISYINDYHLPILSERIRKLQNGISGRDMGIHLNFCRFCGSLHFPLENFDLTEVECGEKKLLIFEHCHSTFEELLSKFQFYPSPLLSSSLEKNSNTDSVQLNSSKLQNEIVGPQKLKNVDPNVFLTFLSKLTPDEIQKLPPLSNSLERVLESFKNDKPLITPLYPYLTSPLTPKKGRGRPIKQICTPDDQENPNKKLSIPSMPINLRQEEILIKFFKSIPGQTPPTILPQNIINQLDEASDFKFMSESSYGINQFLNETSNENFTFPSSLNEILGSQSDLEEILGPNICQSKINPALKFRILKPQPSSSQSLQLLQNSLQNLQLNEPEPLASQLLIRAMACFCRKLLFSSALVYSEEKNNDLNQEERFKVIVPLHTVSAIIKNPESFDFLLSEGLARYSTKEMIEAGALTGDPFEFQILDQLSPK